MTSITESWNQLIQPAPQPARDTAKKTCFEIPWSLLAAIWLASATLRFLLALILTNPFIFIDELWYWQIARTFHRTGQFLLLDHDLYTPSRLYSVVISTAFVFRDPFISYVAAKMMNGLMIGAVAFPVYLLAREFLGKKECTAAALLSVAVTGGAYSGTIMAENLFYPAFMVSFWLAYRTLAGLKAKDGLLAGIAFSVSYFIKPHIMILALAYSLCVGLFALREILQRRHNPENRRLGWRRAFSLAWPLVVFALVLGIFSVPSGGGSFASRIMGGYYAATVQAAGLPAHTEHLGAALLGLLLVVAISSAFFPVFVLPMAAARLRRLDADRFWFCLLTLTTFVCLVGVITRFTLLNDPAIRIHERYIFVISPCLFICYLLFWGEWRKQSLRLAWLGVFLAAFIFWFYAPTMLSWATTSDSPAFTGFFVLSLQHRSRLLLTGIFLFFGLSAASIAAASRNLRSLVIGWMLLFCLLNAGWYTYQQRLLQKAIDEHLDPVIYLARLAKPRRVAVITDDLDMNVAFYSAFWVNAPVRFYSLHPSTYWFASRVDGLEAISKGATGEPVPDYIVASAKLALPFPAEKTFPALGVNIYRNPEQK